MINKRILVHFIGGSLLVFGALSFAATNVLAGGDSTFTGTWSATGDRQLLEMGEKRKSSIFMLEGHVNLKNGIGKAQDYWSKCIGLSDSDSGSQARCVWRGQDGHQVFILLQGDKLEQETSVKGEIIGGTGAAEGISGLLSFTWSTLAIHKENRSSQVGGFAKDLKGQYRLP